MRWGLVLSGGAAYGLANIGTVSVLEQWNLRPDCIAGSSMGSIVAGLYALGHTAKELRTLAEELHPLSLVTLSKKPMKNGLHGGLFHPKIAERLETLVGSATIGDCRIPFVCVAGKVKQPIEWQRIVLRGFTGHILERVEPYVFPENTRMIDAITASSAIPVLFSPSTIGDDTFIDLCHFGAIPARTLKQLQHPDCIIATDTSPLHARLEEWLPAPWRAFLAEGYKELEQSRTACDIVIRPDLPFTPLRFDKAETFIRCGEEAMQERKSEILKLLGNA